MPKMKSAKVMQVDKFTIAAFPAVRVTTNLCESSLQFLQSLCKQMLFRERLVENKELCGGGAVFSVGSKHLKATTT
ncbi:putative nodulin homeobox protein [Helianthus annuus]|uniref:Nodulin homeobox protein n=1 Tax=Helianthus annuus TaxID=4232 RepID=A0A251SDR4_HELAN|nr:putative nodulin homeobox protein [Helianthus annuus]